jgi:hypothetical protein
MKKLVIVGAGAVSLAAMVGQGDAVAAPRPSYAVTCALGGGDTVATWQHARPVQVTFAWQAPAGSAVVLPDLVAPLPPPKSPHGSALTTTPSINGVSPVSVTASYKLADGSTGQAQAACT